MTNRYKKHPLVAGRIIAGEAFVVTADDNVLHELNESGTALWELANSGDSFGVGDAVARLCEEFEVDEETARKDAEACLELFVAKGLLEKTEETR